MDNNILDEVIIVGMALATVVTFTVIVISIFLM